MALIEWFHVVADELPIDTDYATDIPQGRLVSLDTDGYVKLALDTNGNLAIGLAGDSRSQGTTSYTPESGSALQYGGSGDSTSAKGALVIGAWGAGRRNTQNRIADNYNETLASGKMTVYHQGGVFWTDQYDSTEMAAAVPGQRLYAGNVAELGDGCFKTTSTVGWVVAQLFQGPLSFPSGVPGAIQYAGDTNATDFTSLPEGGNSMTWGEFLKIKLIL
jgi:hypothetical protein